ncbi:DUF3225 domain-containing protein [Chlorogloeopsis sp. ULAP01]|uniref:AtzH-like domain-containing protein n=1 Tax=Chlorogloeopsis sp. ULAP01 TaxID=3056483 RepID=UPI0025AB1400|nr:AtzH-like domain-containing protein [Chlorogloeopsis sp. ULAP01]MDM9380204.1 DUF3225 domain-containing protein [Chlorogloeopsis sp. ULAP01]
MVNHLGKLKRLTNLNIDSDAAAVTLEFHRVVDGVERLGRQSQMWDRLPKGWKVVSANVSFLPA